MKGNMLPGQTGSGPVLQQQTEHKPQHLLYTCKAIRALTSAAQNPLKCIKARKMSRSPNSAEKKGRVLLDKPIAPTCNAIL